MAAIKTSGNFYVCDANADRDVAWPEGTRCAVKDATFKAKFYILQGGVFNFLYNQEDAPQASELKSQIENLIPAITGNNGKYLKLVDGVLTWATVSGGSAGYDGDPTTIAQDATHRFVSDTQIADWDSKEDGGAAASALTIAQGYTDDEIEALSDAITTLLLGKSDVGHGHTSSQISDFQTAVSSNSDVAAMKAIIGQGISDGDSLVDTLSEMLAVFTTYSEGVDIAAQLAGKSDTGHTHTAANITDFNSAALAAAPAETGSTIRTALGTTTVGAAINTLVNPSAITFLRMNADNTASALSAAAFVAAIGAQPAGAYLTSSNIVDAIADAVTDKAPSQNAVFDALALKANLNSPTFTTPNIGAATGTSLTTSGAQTSTGGGIGYATGAGGTATQATSRTTTVVLNKLCGNITMFSAAQAAQAIVTFTLTNSFIAATDFILVKHISATNAGAWNFSVVAGAGSCTISIRNISTASITEATPLRFTIIKGVTA